MPRRLISWSYESELQHHESMGKLMIEPLGQLGKLDLHLVVMIQLDQRGLRRTRNLLGKLSRSVLSQKLIEGS